MASHEECVAPTIVATIAFFNSFTITTASVQMDDPYGLFILIPTSDHLFVEGLDHNARARILDGTGRLIIEQEISADIPIDLGNLSDGIYFLQVDSNNRRKTSRFVISRK